jgi:putative hydrolase of the HAD superfamily
VSAIHLITVDLDDTLWPARPTLAAAEQALFRWLQETVGRITEVHDLHSLRAHRMRLRAERSDIAHDFTALRLISLRMLLREFGYADGLAEAGMRLFLEHRNRVFPYSDVSPVLSTLRERYRLVSVTNGNADVERTPLRGLFHGAFRAEDVGAAKPDPALFQAALALAGVGPEQSLHLGDDPVLDVEAARRLGMRAVWVNRGGADWPAELPPPELEVQDLQGLSDWLENEVRSDTD